MKKKRIWLIALIFYLIIIFFCGVLNRDSGTSNTVKLELFWGYDEQKDYLINDKLINVASFIPIGVLAVLIFKKSRLLKTLIIGFFVSLAIECSQLIWHRGVFDVDDLFNNTLGTLVGGLIMVIVVSKKQKYK